ncbi:MAG: hypothetical protein Q4F00_01250 [bacterium]|nr:hypothetical protein [bacterium]
MPNSGRYLSLRSRVLLLMLGLVCLAWGCGCSALGRGEENEAASMMRPMDGDETMWAVFAEIVRDYRRYAGEYAEAKRNNDLKLFKSTYMWYGKRLLTHKFLLEKAKGDSVSDMRIELMMLNALCDRIYDLQGTLRLAKRLAGEQITAEDKKIWNEECAAKQQLIETLIVRCAQKYGGYMLWKGRAEADVLFCYEGVGLDDNEALLKGARQRFYALLDSKGSGNLTKMQRLKTAISRKWSGFTAEEEASPQPQLDSPEDTVWFAVNYLAVSTDNYLCAIRYETNKNKANSALVRRYNEELASSLQFCQGTIAAIDAAAESPLLLAAKGMSRAVEAVQAADDKWRSGAVDEGAYRSLVNRRAADFEQMRSLALCARRDSLLKRDNLNAETAAKQLEADGIAASAVAHIPDLPSNFAQQVHSLEAKCQEAAKS